MRKSSHGLSLSFRLAIIMNSIVFVGFLAFGFIIRSYTTDITENISKQSLHDISDMTIYMVDSSVDSSIKNYLRGIAEVNRDIVVEIYHGYENGLYTEAEAKALAEDVFGGQVIGDTGYIYVVDTNARIKYHPVLAYDSDQSDHQFFIDQTVLREGYIEYDWKNPGEEVERPKALYMTYFEPWDWIISVSSYRSEFYGLVNMEELRENMLSVKLGESGYISTLDSNGVAIVHPFSQGVDLSDRSDGSGNLFIRDMIEQKNGEVIYSWKNPGEIEARDKQAVFKHYPDMDWIIVASIYEDDLLSASQQLSLNITLATIVALVAVVLTTIAAALRLRRIERDNEALEESVRQQNEEIMAQREYLMESEKMSSLGQIVAGVAHEINTPLGASISASSYLDKVNQDTRVMLSEGKMTKNDLKHLMATLDESVKILNINLDKSAQLVQSFKKIAVDQNGVIFETFKLAEYIDTILLSLRHEYKNRKVDFKINCPEDLEITNYPGAFSQVLTNLVMNTLVHAFDETGGQITIDCHQENGNIVIRYSDDGVGIPEDNISQIFEPFFTTNRKNGGSGLGLSLVYNIVTVQMHGKIKCTSIPDVETMFEMVFPSK